MTSVSEANDVNTREKPLSFNKGDFVIGAEKAEEIRQQIMYPFEI